LSINGMYLPATENRSSKEGKPGPSGRELTGSEGAIAETGGSREDHLKRFRSSIRLATPEVKKGEGKARQGKKREINNKKGGKKKKRVG